MAELKKIIKSKYLHRAKSKPCYCKRFNIGGSWDTPSMSRRCVCEHLRTEHENETTICKGRIIDYFELSSGAKSDKYFNIKSMILAGENDDATTLLEAILENLPKIHFKSIGGLELGGALIASQIAYDYVGQESICVIRKGERTHGLKKMIEGQPRSGILLVDDVISTGKTIIDAIRECKKAGYEVVGILCVINRSEWFDGIYVDGYTYPLYSLFREKDFDVP